MEKKTIFKRWWFWVIAVIIVYGSIASVFQSDENEKEKNEEPTTQSAQEKISQDREIDVDNQLLFAEFKVTMNKVRIYEEDGKMLADISFDWLNQSGDGEKMFMSLSALDVMQGENILDEVSGAWDPTNKNSSDIYFPNAENGESKVGLTYELVNEEEPITIRFVPLNEFNEESKEIIVEIN